ncbi:hypothetical protein PVK06_034365 [Gossypium arboreum]|uniref:Uncharacterized protein n=1 Tax=Gossypium arboreum TaxID=29729 RepID=A0ABR0NED7_GOSAR|nr:hypothetical protein PVK06_034365 [Gossypium arboreum]
MLHQVGFLDSVVDVIMHCTITVTYSVVLNGKRGEMFLPTRGSYWSVILDGWEAEKGGFSKIEGVHAQQSGELEWQAVTPRR